MEQSCTDQPHITRQSSCSHMSTMTWSLAILPPFHPSLPVNLDHNLHSTQMLDLFHISGDGPAVEYQPHSNRGVNS